MTSREYVDLNALERFKDNLFEKRIGGLRTEHVVSPSDAYKVYWDASEVHLGRMKGDLSSDPYATLYVNQLYVDNVASRLIELKGPGAKAVLPVIEVSEDVFINDSSVSDRLTQAEKRLDQLGFKKAKGFDIQSITERKTLGFEWTDGTFGLYKLGNLTILNGIGNFKWELRLTSNPTMLYFRISLPSEYSVDEWWPRRNPSTDKPYPSPFGGQTPDFSAVLVLGEANDSVYAGTNMRFDYSDRTIDFEIPIPFDATVGYERIEGQLRLQGICWANGSLPTPIEV